MPYKIEDQFCEFIKNDEIIYPGLKAVSNIPDMGVCPWPEGKYFFHIIKFKNSMSKLFRRLQS
jgi:hypothetical protein